DAVGRSEIDQIAAVNDERAEAQFDAAISETLRACIRDIRAAWAAAPHSRAGREYLQRVGAEIMCDFERGRDVARDRGVDSDADAAVHPSGEQRFRYRFRTVFITGDIRLS